MILSGFVGWSYNEPPVDTIERRRHAGCRIVAQCNISPGAKRALKGPPALFIWYKVHKPFVSGFGAGLPGIAVGGVIAGHDVLSLSVDERYVQAIIQEWIRLGVFAGFRAIEGKCYCVPLLEVPS